MRIFTYVGCIFALGILNGCVTEKQEMEDPQVIGKLSVEEARAFFENNQVLIPSTRSDSDEKSFDPGEFSPQWEMAVAVEDNHIASVEVPILTQYRYRGLCSEFQSGKAQVCKVDIFQKLIVVKDDRNQQMAQYILTLIPDGDCYKKYGRNVVDKFLNTKDRGSYSGVVIYSIPGFNIPIRVNKYFEGKKVAGVFLVGSKTAVAKKIKIAKEIIGDIFISRTSVSAITRSWGEDDWSLPDFSDDNWWDDYLYMGSQLYEDEMNHETWFNGYGYWTDTNDDGMPDHYYPILDPDPNADEDIGLNEDPNEDLNIDYSGADDDGGRGSGIEGGESTNDGEQTTMPEPEKVDCEELADPENLMDSQIHYMYFSPKIDEFTGSKNFSSIEYGMTLSQNLVVSAIYTDNKSSSIQIRIEHEDIAAIHNHPRGTPPSPQDVWALIHCANDNNNCIEYVYVYALPDIIYCLHVEDRALVEKFYSSVMKDVSVYNDSSKWTEFKNVLDEVTNLIKTFYFCSVDTAKYYAWQYVLSHYQTGIRLYKKSANGSHFTAAATIISGEILEFPDTLTIQSCE